MIKCFSFCTLLGFEFFTKLAGLEQSQEQQEGQWEKLMFSRHSLLRLGYWQDTLRLSPCVHSPFLPKVLKSHITEDNIKE